MIGREGGGRGRVISTKYEVSETVTEKDRRVEEKGRER
jgi:hypothetical protein